MKIKIIDPTICQTDSPKELKEFLTVKKTFWKQAGPYKKEHQDYDSPLVDKRGFFLTGFLPRVIRACKTRSIPIEIEGSIEKIQYDPSMQYPTIKLFEDQKVLVEKTLQIQRGIIQSPTGTGKTVLCYAILHSLKSKKSLVICPSKSIMSQTAKEFKENFRMKVSVFGDGEKDLSGDIVIGLINSLNKLKPVAYCDLFDVIIVDEVHHCSSIPTEKEKQNNEMGMYYKFLTGCLAPVRVGLTATVDEEGTERAMAAEGLIGPVIGKFTFGEAVETKRIAKPKLKLIPIPINLNTKEVRSYHDVYNIGIVFNRIRNNIIADYIVEQTKLGKTSLVFVKFIPHAEKLTEMIKSKGVPCEYVIGEVKDREREEIKIQLSNKKLMCVVATAAWREGVNLPALDIVINAAGYLSEKPTIQMAGRVLRIAEGKTEGIIVDFLDSGRYLADHCVKRLLTYAELGWLE